MLIMPAVSICCIDQQPWTPIALLQGLMDPSAFSMDQTVRMEHMVQLYMKVKCSDSKQ